MHGTHLAMSTRPIALQHSCKFVVSASRGHLLETPVFLGQSLSFGEELRFEHNLTKSDVTLKTHKMVQMPVNTR